MAFLDDLNKKFSQASQKAKDFSDSARINSLINEEEKKINAYYFQTGKLFVSLHANDYEPAFANIMAMIADSEARLRDLRNQLQQLKGSKKCPQCGFDVPLNSAFCPNCGTQMPISEAESNLVKCASCGQFVGKNLRFCTSCGKPMNAVPVVEQPVYTQPAVTPEPVYQAVEQPAVIPEPVPQVIEQPPVVPESAPEITEQAPAAQTNGSFCANCGCQIPVDGVFCPECGIKIN